MLRVVQCRQKSKWAEDELVMIALALVSLFGSTVANHSPLERKLHGTIVLEEQNGSRTKPKTGSIRLYGRGRGDVNVTAAIEDGTFEASFPDALVFIGAIELDGIACWSPTPWGEFRFPESALVVARRVRPAFVHVVDAKTGKNLERVDVFFGHGGRAERNELALPTTASPFEVPLFDDENGRGYGWIGMRAYRIESPGYATRSIWVDPTEGGTRTFEMAEEARVRITFTGEPPIPDGATAHLTLHGPSRLLSLTPRRPITNSRVEFDALAAGTWNLGISDPGESQQSRPARIELAAGQVLALELDSNSTLPNPRHVMHELRGTLEFEGGTPTLLPSMDLQFRRSADAPFHASEQILPNDFVQDSQRANVWHWVVGKRPDASWRAAVPEWAWAQEFELSGDAAIELVVPTLASGRTEESSATGNVLHAPMPVRFDLVDQDTGEIVPPEIAQASRWIRGVSRPCERAGEHWTAAARKGAMRIHVESMRYCHEERTLLVNGTDAVVRVPIRMVRSFTLRAYDGDARLCAPEIQSLLSPSIEPLDPRNEWLGNSTTMYGENEFSCAVAGGGRFRVTLPPNDLYEPHAPVEVEVKPDGMVPVAVFRLTRADRAKK